MRRLLIATAFVLGSAAAAFAAAPVTTVDTSIGKVLAGDNGMTLYTFKKDAKGVSNCNDQCAQLWPPLMAKTGDMADAPYSIIDRKDGSKQWAKDGMPLYFWSKDAKKGDTTGNGFKGAWDAARP